MVTFYIAIIPNSPVSIDDMIQLSAVLALLSSHVLITCTWCDTPVCVILDILSQGVLVIFH